MVHDTMLRDTLIHDNTIHATMIYDIIRHLALRQSRINTGEGDEAPPKIMLV